MNAEKIVTWTLKIRPNPQKDYKEIVVIGNFENDESVYNWVWDVLGLAGFEQYKNVWKAQDKAEVAKKVLATNKMRIRLEKETIDIYLPAIS